MSTVYWIGFDADEAEAVPILCPIKNERHERVLPQVSLSAQLDGVCALTPLAGQHQHERPLPCPNSLPLPGPRCVLPGAPGPSVPLHSPPSPFPALCLPSVSRPQPGPVPAPRFTHAIPPPFPIPAPSLPHFPASPPLPSPLLFPPARTAGRERQNGESRLDVR